MKFTLVFLLSLVCAFNSAAQQLTLETNLNSIVNETSGLVYINNTLITHNDSGNTNTLFDVDTSTGLVTRMVTISNATNTDWEDITEDGTYIYIGDFGNFQGDRTNLKVYRILIADYFNNTTVTADVIDFTYNNQTDFTTRPFANNFDAETLIYFNNKLYIFTKNWEDSRTNIYELSKDIGIQTATLIDNFNSDGLITGGSYNTTSNEVLLCGYGINGAFVVQLNSFNNGLFTNGNIIKTAVTVTANSSLQIEGITGINGTEYYVSGEANGSSLAALYSFNISTLTAQDTSSISVSFYPNPAQNEIILSTSNLTTEFYNLSGQLVKTATTKRIDISNLSSGVYLLKIKRNNKGITRKLLVLSD